MNDSFYEVSYYRGFCIFIFFYYRGESSVVHFGQGLVCCGPTLPFTSAIHYNPLSSQISTFSHYCSLWVTPSSVVNLATASAIPGTEHNYTITTPNQIQIQSNSLHCCSCTPRHPCSIDRPLRYALACINHTTCTCTLLTLTTLEHEHDPEDLLHCTNASRIRRSY